MTPPRGPAWEYDFHYIASSDANWGDVLARRGQQGWELATLVDYGANGISLIFKRRVPSPSRDYANMWAKLRAFLSSSDVNNRAAVDAMNVIESGERER